MAKNPSASINLGLPVLPEVDSPELYAALVSVYNAIRNTLYAVDSYTGNTLVTPDEYDKINAFGQLLSQKTAVLYVKLTEDVSAGHLINLYDSGGLRARKSLSPSRRVHAFAAVSGLSGETIPVCMFGLCNLIGGLTIGTEYYAGTTAGQLQSGATSQRVGIAIGPQSLWFTP